MRTVHVGVRHDDDFAVATLGKIRFASVPDAKGGNHTLNFFILQNAHVVRLVGVDNLTAQGKDRLKFANTSAFRRTARGVSFHEVDFAFVDFSARAVAQFSGHAAMAQRVLSRVYHLARFSCAFARFRRYH